MKKEKVLSKSYMVSVGALLAAMSVVLAFAAKTAFGSQPIRFTVENIPIFISSFAYGPVMGMLVAVIADLASCVIAGQSPLPLITVGAAAIGLVSGILYRLLPKKRAWSFVSVLGAHAVGSMAIKTYALYQFYGKVALWRIPLYLAISAVEALATVYVLENGQIRKLLKSAGGFASEKDTDMNKALDYVREIASTGSRPGLDRITELLGKLGNPQKDLKIVHVAGTNGKGSFCSMLDSVLTDAGYKTAVFTSPHMIKYNERMRYCGRDISDAEFASLIFELKPIADKMADRPTEFELLTAAGYLWFSRKKPDICIIECGMGGRYDATNVIESPVLSVITGIAMDHMQFLGDTIEKIAAEKAGIVKSGRPALFGGENDSAYDVIRAEADGLGSEMFRTDRAAVVNVRCSENGTTFDFGKYDGVKLGLIGTYQPYNAANVITAAEILSENGFDVTEENIRRGLEKAEWIGRFEILSRDPLVVFDGGHNTEGVEAAVRSADAVFGGRKIAVISGVLADKEHGTMSDLIAGIARKVFTVTPDSSRALPAEKYAAEYAEKGTDALACGSFDEAVEKGYEYASENRVPLLCVGSLYSYSGFVSALEKIKEKQIGKDGSK